MSVLLGWVVEWTWLRRGSRVRVNFPNVTLTLLPHANQELLYSENIVHHDYLCAVLHFQPAPKHARVRKSVGEGQVWAVGDTGKYLRSGQYRRLGRLLGG